MQNDTYFLPRVVRGTIHAAGRAISTPGWLLLPLRGNSPSDRPYERNDTEGSPMVPRIRKPYARIDTAGTAGMEKMGAQIWKNTQLQLEGK